MDDPRDRGREHFAVSAGGLVVENILQWSLGTVAQTRARGKTKL